MSSVAVKNPETRSAGPLDRLHVAVLAGVVYVVGSLAILFELLPWLWWAPGPLGFARPSAGYPAVGATVGLLLVGLAVAAGLAYLGTRLMGPSPAPGAKAGIFTGLVTLLVIVLVTRWVSYLFEGWVYDSRSVGQSIGIALTVALGVALLALAVRLIFMAPTFGAKMVAFEEQGWFSATSFKRSQGRLVRRGTIVSILALVGCGIYSLIAHGSLVGGDDNWGIGIPFTAPAQVRSLNDGRLLYTERNKRKADDLPLTLPERVGENPLGVSKDSRPELNEKGEAVGLVVTTVIADSPADKAGVRDGDTITAVNAGDEPETRPVTDVDSLKEQAEAAAEKKVASIRLHVLRGSGFDVDRAEFRNLNDRLKGDYLKITDRGDSPFEPGQVVKKDDYEKERVKIVGEKGKEPTFKAPDAATASFPYATIPLLPHVKYTLPILLAALGLWLAWRVVNVPVFADFLIATEAELNKVSWTTRPRLIQDTIVVLVTVLLFTIFLFVVDVAWGQVLSWPRIGVLKLPESGPGTTPPDQKW